MDDHKLANLILWGKYMQVAVLRYLYNLLSPQITKVKEKHLQLLRSSFFAVFWAGLEFPLIPSKIN
jgi:hypothetical protein